MKARDVMSQCVVTVHTSATLFDAARAMWDRDVGFMPVVDRETDQIRGVVTDRDICMGAFTQGKALDQIPVQASMSHAVISCGPDDELELLESRMRDHHIRRLPVLDERQKVIGVVSLDDLARVALDGDGKRELRKLKQDVSETLALVSRPQPPRCQDSCRLN